MNAWICFDFLGVRVGLGPTSWAFRWGPSPRVGPQGLSAAEGSSRPGPYGPLLLGSVGADDGLSSYECSVDFSGDPGCCKMGPRSKADALLSPGQIGGNFGAAQGTMEGELTLPCLGCMDLESRTRRTGLRASQRLADGEQADILSKAINRKICLREGDGAAEAVAHASRLSIRKAVAKSRRCGVRLDDTQASSFLEFVRHSA